MNNEELVLMVQQNDREAAAQLWEQVHRLIFKLMGKYFPLCPRFNMDTADLEQEAYFAMMRAAEAFKPDKGYLFTSYLSLHIDNVAKEALGLRGHATRPQNVRSLDEPIKGLESEDLTLADSIPDETATQEMERVQDDWQRKQLAAVMGECLAGLSEEHKNILHARYYESQTLKQIAEAQDCAPERCKQLEYKALRELRRPRNSRKLKPYYDALDLIRSRAHVGVGFSTFKYRGASQPEWIIEMLEKYTAQEVAT